MNSLLRLFVASLFLAVALTVVGQSGRFRVMTYNVENLFDTCHDEGFDDYEFLPSAARHWDSHRYRAKLSAIGRTIIAAGGDVPIDLVALCEVENDSVIRDLCERTRLARLGYHYVVTHSRDSRGLDVALLYQPLRFCPLADSAYVLPYDAAYGRPTRDLLHVSGLLLTGDTLDVFVCHMPSHRGSSPAAERLHEVAMRALRTYADSVMNNRQNGYVLMMGDFNDDYTAVSIAETLGAYPVAAAMSDEALQLKAWYVLSADSRTADGVTGTYKYRGHWTMLDQIIASGSLLNPRSRIYRAAVPCSIYAPAFLLARDRVNGGVKPRRTFIGTTYIKGTSDHLPLIAEFGIEATSSR